VAALAALFRAQLTVLTRLLFNAVSLVNAICSTMEEYYIKRLKQYAYGDTSKNRLQLQSQINKASYLKKT
jgi:hypothetical protein